MPEQLSLMPAADGSDADEPELRRYEQADPVFPEADPAVLRAPPGD